MRATVIAVLSLLAACVSVPTPSGRPEVRVRLAPQQAKSRIVSGLSQIGYMVTASDDIGVSATRPLDASQQVWVGPGSWAVRFNLTQSGEGCTEIRGTVFMQGSSPQDCSDAKAGHDFQVFLERTFRDCLTHSPYVREQ